MKPVKYTRFRGINNRLPPERLRPLGDDSPGQFVADAVNVDLTDAGSFQRRPGYVRIGTDEQCRGLVGGEDHGYYVAGTEIKHLDVAGLATVIGAVASQYAPITSCTTPLGLVMSDTFSLQLLNGRNVSEITPPEPLPMPVVSTSAGALAAGAYGLLFVHEDAQGRRSPCTMPVYVAVTALGAVTVTQPARPYTLGIYMTAPDGDVFYRVGQLSPAQTSFSIAGAAFDGESMTFEPQASLPAGHVMAYHKGRLYSAVNNLLCFSMPYQYGVFRPAFDYIPFDAPVAVLASIDEGLFIATTTQTFFLPGGDPTKGDLRQSLPFGAVPHSITHVPNSNDWIWHSTRGPVRTRDARLELLQDEVIAFDKAARGAAVVREQNGLRSLITSLAGTMSSGGAVVGSYMDAEVIKGA